MPFTLFFAQFSLFGHVVLGGSSDVIKPLAELPQNDYYQQ